MVKTRNVTNERQQNANWLASGISIVALILSIIAFANTNAATQLQRNFNELRSDIEEFQEDLRLRQEFETARFRLEEVRKDIAEGMDPQTAQQEIAIIRKELERNLSNAGTRVQEAWQPIDVQLERLELQLREGGVNVLDNFDKILQSLREEIRYDE